VKLLQPNASFTDAAAYHLKYTLGKDPARATEYDRFVAVCHVVRDQLVERWIETQHLYHAQNVKRACYVSLEYLLGRALLSNLVNLKADEAARAALKSAGIDLSDLLEQEPDPGLGNGGLGRLAACLLESLATLSYPAIGYGLRYEYGLFRQKLQGGFQVEEPDAWLRRGYPFEFPRPEYTYPVQFGGRVEADPERPLRFRWVDAHVILGTAFDIPVAGYGCDTVNTLRMWSARAADDFDLEDFSSGDYAAAVEHKVNAENLTKVLYPDDRVNAGRELRLRQQYLLVSCSVQDILRRHLRQGNALEALADKTSIQLNDTHPALTVAELMRQLGDVHGMEWGPAFEVTRGVTSYTNHTLMGEALEQWPVELLERLLPRHLQIIYEINRRLLDEVSARWPGDAERVRRMSIVNEQQGRRIRMANLAVVGSHAVNGVSTIHSGLLRSRLLPDFDEAFPGRFTSITNGVTPRRWMLVANPGLSKLLTERLGDDRWIVDLERLRGLEPAAEEPDFRARLREVKRAAKRALADHAAKKLDIQLDPDSLFDVQIKRLHEYKRQLLNLLHVVHVYLRLRDEPDRDLVPRTVMFGAKAAPAYWQAKRIIRLAHAIGETIDRDPLVRGRLKVAFLPDYRVSLAERIIPASDLSEQISTAGTEASGTGNMKLGLNGALTIGTLDGANIEMREAVGPENFFAFGLDASEVAALHASGRNPGWEVYHENDEVRRTVDFLFSGHFGSEPDTFDPLRHALVERADPYMCLVDLMDYVRAQERVSALYRDEEAWSRASALNIARLGRFSSDRMAREYAERIWGLSPLKVSILRKATVTRIMKKVVPEA
jgi:glycogen phosphorylase